MNMTFTADKKEYDCNFSEIYMLPGCLSQQIFKHFYWTFEESGEAKSFTYENQRTRA